MIEKVIEVEGKTVEEAINAGLERIKKAREDVTVEILRDPSSIKLFGFALKAKVRIKYKEEDISFLSEPARRGKEFIENILHDLGIEGKVKNIRETDEIIFFNIESPSEELTKNNAELLESIQALTYIVVNKNSGSWKKILLDMNDYRKKKEVNILNKVKQVIERVKKTGKPYWVGPYAAYERKVIHMFVDKEKGVKTESEGKGLYKKVWIKPE